MGLGAAPPLLPVLRHTHMHPREHVIRTVRETPRLCAQETHANPERGKRQERAQHLLVQLLLRKPCSLLDEPPIEPASAPLVILVAPPLKGPKEIQEAP